MKPSASLLVSVCLSAAAGGALQHFLLTPAVRDSAASPDLDEGSSHTLASILEELRAIRVKGEAPAVSSGGREAAVPGAAPRDGSKELLAAIERLREVIAHAPVKLGNTPAPLAVTRLSLAPAEVIELVKPLAPLEDEEVARRYRFLSSQELLQRFGPPQSLSVSNGVQFWEYKSANFPKDGQVYAEVTFHVVDGFVFTTSRNYID